MPEATRTPDTPARPERAHAAVETLLLASIAAAAFLALLSSSVIGDSAGRGPGTGHSVSAGLDGSQAP